MVIKNILIEKDDKKIVLSAEVVFRGAKPERMYFLTHQTVHHFVDGGNGLADASPFLAAVLLPCMKTGEDIVVEGSVSPTLLKNMEKIMDLVASWDVGLKKIVIKSKVIKSSSVTRLPHSFVARNDGKVATFFSAGVDSFYTYLKNKKEISHLILVHGFDIPLQNTEFFDEVRKTVEAVAKEEKKEAIIVETNVAEIVEKRLIWDFAHGGALAAVALFLQGGLGTVLIPASVRKDNVFPYGTRPDLDKLWSTETLQIRSDGSEYDRLGKVLNGVGQSPLALRYLRVCVQNLKGKYNCSRCYKCLQTMIELECAGTLDQAKTFENQLDLDAVRNMYYDYALKYNKQGEVNLEVLRKQKRNPELQAAIVESLERSKKPKLSKKVLQIVAAFDQKYNNRRLYRFVFSLNDKQDRGWLFKFLLKKGILK